jgi:hypothetical protein
MDVNIYVVTMFGCNSSHNDMYPPMVFAYSDRERAYKVYNDEKDKILKEKEKYEIDFRLYSESDGECIIQKGYDEDYGAKRPVGVKIIKQKIDICLQ